MRVMSSSSSSPVTFMGMIMVVLIQAGNMVVNKVALSEGTNKYCLILYSDALCTLIYLPSLFLLFRSSSPPLTPSLLFKFFLLSLIGLTAHVCSLAGTELSSPTLGITLMNIVPALTFSIAIFFRMEKLDWRSSSSQAKVLGTVVSIAGAFVATLYKGHPIMFVSSSQPHLALSPQSKWALGGFFFALEALLVSMWYITQVVILKDYPEIMIINSISNIFATAMAASISLVLVNDAKFWTVNTTTKLVVILKDYPEIMIINSISNLFGTAMAASISLVLVTDAQSWKLTLEKGLVSIVYSAVATGVLRIYVIQWCLKRTGPLYVSVFKPVGIIFAVALGVIFLGDPLRSGSLIGAAVIVCGFYAVIWGKSKEEKCQDMNGEVGTVSAQTPNHKTRLLDTP